MNQRSDHDPTKRRRWEKAGQKRLDEQELSSASFLPFRWWEVFDLKCTVEYPVRDLLSRDQLLPDRSRRRISFCLSGLCHRHRSEAFFHVSITRTLEQPDLSCVKLQFFTKNLDVIVREIKNRLEDFKVTRVADVQRKIEFSSPAGPPIEIWSGDETLERPNVNPPL